MKNIIEYLNDGIVNEHLDRVLFGIYVLIVILVSVMSGIHFIFAAVIVFAAYKLLWFLYMIVMFAIIMLSPEEKLPRSFSQSNGKDYRGQLPTGVHLNKSNDSVMIAPLPPDPLIVEIHQNKHLYQGVEFSKKDGRFSQNRLQVRKATGNHSRNFALARPVERGSDEERAILDVSKQYGNNIAYMVAAMAMELQGQAHSASSRCGGIYAPKGKEQDVFVGLLNQGFRIFVPMDEMDLIESQVKRCRKSEDQESEYEINVCNK